MSNTVDALEALAAEVEDAHVSGVCAGVCAARREDRDTAPGMIAIPSRWTEAESAAVYARGYREGWESLHTRDVAWAAEWERVVHFGRVLAAAGWLDRVPEVFDYLDRPDKWAREHSLWTVMGTPEPDCGAHWRLFTKLLDSPS